MVVLLFERSLMRPLTSCKTMQKPFEWEHDDESWFTTHVSFVTDHGCRDTLLAISLRPVKQDIQAWRIMEQCNSISYVNSRTIMVEESKAIFFVRGQVCFIYFYMVVLLLSHLI